MHSTENDEIEIPRYPPVDPGITVKSTDEINDQSILIQEI